MSFNEAVKSQQENKPPERGERNRRYMLEHPDMVRKLSEERRARLEAKGFASVHILDGGLITLPIKDCVRFPNGKYYPKIEYLMDKLGPKTVTDLIRKQGFHWARSDSLTEYRKWRDELVIKVANGETIV